MKKVLLSLIGGTLALGLGATSFGSDEISKSNLTEKYTASAVIKSKYDLKGAALAKEVKSDPKDSIKLELGEENDTEFVPSFKVTRWDEVSLKVKPNLTKIASKDKVVSFVGDKVKVDTPDTSYSMYELQTDETHPEGAFEYEIELKSKPKTNVVTLNIESQGLDFFYQPALTQEEIDQGAVRPENVVGSYAVYASENKINYVGGKEYKAGKVGHIYRPKIVDSAGTEVWGDLHIENGILSVTIPQSFLDTAVYPVRHAAGLTFGYTSKGGSVASFSSVGTGDFGVFGGKYMGAAGTLTDIAAYLEDSTSHPGGHPTWADVGGSLPINYAVYQDGTDGVKVDTVDINANTNGFNGGTFPAVQQTITAQNYWLYCMFNNAGLADYFYFAYDSSGGDGRAIFATGPGAFPATLDDADFLDNNSNKYSIYATYTASGGGGGATPNNDVIFFE